MTKKWTKPIVGVVGIAAAGAFTLALDGVAQALNPLHPKEQHDSFALVAPSTTTTSITVLMQNMVTGDVFELPMPELPRFGLVK